MLIRMPNLRTNASISNEHLNIRKLDAFNNWTKMWQKRNCRRNSCEEC